MNMIQFKSYFFRVKNKYGWGHMFNYKWDLTIFALKKMTMYEPRDGVRIKSG